MKRERACSLLRLHQSAWNIQIFAEITFILLIGSPEDGSDSYAIRFHPHHHFRFLVQRPWGRQTQLIQTARFSGIKKQSTTRWYGQTWENIRDFPKLPDFVLELETLSHRKILLVAAKMEMVKVKPTVSH